jgi:hypothetical protein
MKRWLTPGALLTALLTAGCSDDDGETTSTPGDLPPEFVTCMAANGFEITSSAEIHSAPPQVLQECFGSNH